MVVNELLGGHHPHQSFESAEDIPGSRHFPQVDDDFGLQSLQPEPSEARIAFTSGPVNIMDMVVPDFFEGQYASVSE